MKKKIFLLLVFILIIIIPIILSNILKKNNKSKSLTTSPDNNTEKIYSSVGNNSVEEQREVKNMAKEGRQEYAITQAANSPQFYKAVIDPEKVSPNQEQSMTVYVKDEKSEIESVKAEIETDTKTQTYDLDLVEGDKKDGVWKGSWRVNDTSTKTYRTKFIATNKIGEKSEITLSWTDPGTGCIGTDCTISSGTITISGVDGADGGTLTINGGSVTVPSGATLLAAALNISGTGVLIVNSGGVVHIASGNTICMTDADSDGAPANTTQIAYCTSGRRRYLMYTLTPDCYESNANAKPGQTACFTVNRGDGSFDYNCDGSATPCSPIYYTLATRRNNCTSAGYDRNDQCKITSQTLYYTNTQVGCGDATGYTRGSYVQYYSIDYTHCQCDASGTYYYQIGTQGTQSCN